MMGAREWLNQHPKVAIGGGITVAVLAITLVVVQIRAGRHRYPTAIPNLYFTVDDGKTFFVDNASNVAPFDYNGQQAVRAYVYKCGSQKFVGYMERYNHKYHDLVVAKGSTPEAERFGREIKRPGDPKWFPCLNIQTEEKLTEVHCPTGSADIPEALDPDVN
jgi:hypothetical protein